MIDGVHIKPLKKISDDRGTIMHMLRSTDSEFLQFGEIYFSWINPSVIKGWHRHRLTTVNFAVPVGRVKVVIHDNRKDSKTSGQSQEVILGEEHYNLLSISPGLWYGFVCMTQNAASMIANCATHPHDKTESESLEIDDIPYDWRVLS